MILRCEDLSFHWAAQNKIYLFNKARNNMLGVILSTGGVLYLVVKGELPTSETFSALNRGDL